MHHRNRYVALAVLAGSALVAGTGFTVAGARGEEPGRRSAGSPRPRTRTHDRRSHHGRPTGDGHDDQLDRGHRTVHDDRDHHGDDDAGDGRHEPR